METDYDVVVIGAGVGGLAAAGLLAQSGLRVLVLERHSVVGGYCSTFRRSHFIFDAAVHAIGGWQQGDVIRRWCAQMEIAEDALSCVDLHPFYTIDVAGERIAVPANLDALAQMLIERSPRDAEAIHRLIEEMKREGASVLQATLHNTPMSIAQGRIAQLSWAEYLANRFISPEIELLLHALCIYGGLEPQRNSALFMIAMYYSYHRGAFYPIGSTQRFVDTLAKAVQRWGGTIRRKTSVQRILMDKQGAVMGVRLANGDEILASQVISNADATKTLTEMIDRNCLPRTWQQRLRRATYASSAVVLYLAVRDEQWRKSVSSHETFYLPAWRPISATDFYYQPGQPQQPYVFSLSIPSLSDAGLARPGHHVVALMGLAQATIVEQLREERGKASIEQDMRAHAERLLPGINQCVLYREVATPRTFERYTANSHGAIYGWAKDTQHVFNSFTPQTPIKGLYLAGHWTVGVHGVYGSFISGVAVAQRMIDNMKQLITAKTA